ncbi:MAG: hypothetical protein ACK41W_03915 [Cyanobacteriota bacterium]|jgi:hypothetical protein
MKTSLCVVQVLVSGWVIYRETTGGYVVSRKDRPLKVRAATLAGAHAACHGLERSQRVQPMAGPRSVKADAPLARVS